MIKQGFDNDKYLAMQSDHIRERISKFGDKLYLEFGGKLYDDYHASRVLPGFEPDSKLRMLMQLADQAEIVIVINAADITKNKVRYDLGITYDLDVLRLIHVFTDRGLYVSSVVITRYVDTPAIQQFKHKLEKLGLKVYRHYEIDGYDDTGTWCSTAFRAPFRLSSAMKVTERMTISRRHVHSLSLQLRGREAERWRPAFPSCTTKISAA